MTLLIPDIIFNSYLSRSCWYALAGHQMSLCVSLSTWLVVCYWCHVLSCLLSDRALLVISLLLQLRPLCPPRYPHICLPIYSPGVCSPVLFGCLTSGVTSCECYLCLPACLPACLFFPLGVVFVHFSFILLLKDAHSPALESSSHLSSCNMTEPNSQMRTQRRMGSHRPPAPNISSHFYALALHVQDAVRHEKQA